MPQRAPGTGFWARLVNAVMSRPVMLTILSGALLLAVAAPALRLRTGTTGIEGLPSTIDGIAGIKLINEKFPFGQDIRMDVVVTNPTDPAVAAAMQTAYRARRCARGRGRRPDRPNGGRRARGADLVPDDGQSERRGESGDRRGGAQRHRAGALPNPDRRRGPRHCAADVYVSGQTARTMDIVGIYSDATPRIFGFVLGLSFLLMLLAFRSIVIPIKAILLNLLSTAAAFGVLVLVFREGWFADALGITPGGVIESWVPIFIFTILFGLSMDYHLFILTRIKEARDRGLDSRAAVARGISVTSGTITSAASIMVVVFAVFVTFKFVFIQQLGLGLAVAVFIDATLIRSVLLPATMTLLGDWNWWLPRWLGWLPHVTIESASAEPETV